MMNPTSKYIGASLAPYELNPDYPGPSGQHIHECETGRKVVFPTIPCVSNDSEGGFHAEQSCPQCGKAVKFFVKDISYKDIEEDYRQFLELRGAAFDP